MKKFKTEITSVICAMVVAYCWQLFALLVCYISDPHGDFITKEMFIPWSGVQLAIAPTIAWLFMELFKVTWLKKWIRITSCGLAFFMPFLLIVGITILITPSLWREPIYWLANVGISILLAFTVFKPFLHFKYSDVEQN